MTPHRSGDPAPAAAPAATAVLEYVTLPTCADCRRFEELLRRVLPDYEQGVEAREVRADSGRGIELTIERGALMFPVIVLNDEIIGIESIPETELRAALDRALGR